MSAASNTPAGTPTSDDQASRPTRPENREPYQQAYYPPVPTAFTRHMRVNPLWQAVRLFVINLKIFRLMTRSHH
ncbi:MAG: hypothetical protein EA400_10350 [Chromatiaceae bacterium]|nr:MAG: hypothetical protein EA400_10350 [Chromatiaceae bacterium]